MHVHGCFYQVTAVLNVLLVHTVLAADAIPDYVTTYAPLVYLDANEAWLPTDLDTFAANTRPELNYTLIPQLVPQQSNYPIFGTGFSALNDFGKCDFAHFDDCQIYLTLQQNFSTTTRWLHGTQPDPQTGATVGASSSVVVVNDKGSGVVDAFYFYFYAFNQGLDISGTDIGNHVGDWEHTMLRFRNGVPETMWYSAHDAGFVYTYSAVPKQGNRPITYASKGGHANYPTPGLQSRNYGIITLNDTTSAGSLWDPVQSALFYTFKPLSATSKQGNFTAVRSTSGDSTKLPSTDWLYFLGRWGDKEYPTTNPLQVDLGIAKAWESGPTGPYDKDLNRKETCPDRVFSCTTSTVVPVASSDIKPSRTLAAVPSSLTLTSATGGLTAITGSVAASPSPTKSRGQHSRQIKLILALAISLMSATSNVV